MRSPRRTLRGAVSRGGLLLIALVVGSGLVLGMFWYGTTFTTRLGDDVLAERLGPQASAREAMHAIEEMSRRFEENRPGTDRWIEPFLQASRRPEEGVRVAAAWCMQFDPRRPELTLRLREMAADDRSPLVRRNAATSLAVARDAAALPGLRAMLEPFAVTTPIAGTVETVAATDDIVRQGDLVARIAADAEFSVDVRAPVPGSVGEVVAAEGATIGVGAVLVRVRPSTEHLRNAFGGLALVGETADAERLDLLADGRSGLAPEIQDAARAAAKAIRSRLDR